MERTQRYIGTPNGVILCVDSMEGDFIKGRIYNSYKREPVHFSSMYQIISELEKFYDFLDYPHPSMRGRTFQKENQEGNLRQDRVKVMKDNELLSKHGDLGTFIIRVQHRQNSTWQGRITWSDQNKTQNFRSIWEMIKLIENALNTVSDQEDGETHF